MKTKHTFYVNTLFQKTVLFRGCKKRGTAGETTEAGGDLNTIRRNRTYELVSWVIRVKNENTQSDRFPTIINPHPANVDNVASSYQCWQMADGI